MKRNVCGIFIGSCWALTLLAACNGRSTGETARWNDLISTFSMEEEEVCYTLPTDVSSWAIAGEENLPPAMAFFGIDREEEVCVGIFRPDAPRNGVASSRGYSLCEVYEMVREISSPQSGQKTVDEKLESIPLHDSGKKSWYFSHLRRIVDSSLPSDTFTINYSGYLFDGKTRPLGIVVISSVDPSDSIGRRILDKYVTGLDCMR